MSLHEVSLILWVGELKRYPFSRRARARVSGIIRLPVRIYWSISCGNSGADEMITSQHHDIHSACTLDAHVN